MLGSGGPLAPSPRLRAGRHAALGVTLALVLLALAGLARSSAATPGSTLPGVSGSPEITSVSCPTASFCAAAAGSFDLLTSTDPTGGAGAWLRTPTPTGTNARAVSCPDASLCVAVDNNGDVLESTDPTGGTGAWTVTPIGPTDDFMLAVSCSSPSLCVASDDNGNLFVSSNPTGGSSAWTTDHVDGTAFITSVSCVAGPLCVAVDNAGNAISATDPTAGAGAWTATKVAPQTSLSGISCPSETLCVADGFVNGAGGGVVTSTGPTGATGAWQVTQPESSARFPEAVSCLPSGLCAIVDDLGNLLTTTDPTGGAGTWSLVNIDGSTTVDAISCAAGPLCVAADTLGNVLTSTDPAGGAGAWTLAGANATRMLSVSETGNGSGTVSGAGLDCPSTCSTNYTTGSLATLTAVAASGSTFVGWSGGGCSGTGTCVTPVNDDETVVATFVTAPPTAHQLTIDFAGSGHGTVTALGSTCSTDCTLDVPFGEFDPFSLVALTETPAPGQCSAAGPARATEPPAARPLWTPTRLSPRPSLRPPRRWATHPFRTLPRPVPRSSPPRSSAPARHSTSRPRRPPSARMRPRTQAIAGGPHVLHLRPRQDLPSSALRWLHAVRASRRTRRPALRRGHPPVHDSLLDHDALAVGAVSHRCYTLDAS